MILRTLSRPLAVGTAALAAALVLAGCGGDDDTASTTIASSSAPQPSAAKTSSPAASGEHNDADVTFTQMMIPHHAQAIEMSDLILGKDDVDPQVIALAEHVVAAQQPEIELMTGWLQAWGEDIPEMGMGMTMDHPMNGMLAQSDVDAIGAATGVDAARLYLEGLKAHHAGAIEMAQAEVDDGMNPEVIALAKAIITAQQAEITEIEDLLTTL